MNSQDTIKKEFVKAVDKLSYGSNRWEVFRDFTECAAIAIAQPFYRSEELEDQYMNIIEKYPGEEAFQIAELLGMVVNALELKSCDFLGAMFMELELGNARTGQFFTPYSLCEMTAELIWDTDYDGKKVITLNEPAVGGGGMVIAFAEVMKRQGFNPANLLHVITTDIDKTCFNMCYIQLSLMGIPAIVVHGDTLRMQEYEARKTPVHFIHGWDTKLEKLNLKPGEVIEAQFSQEQIEIFKQGRLFETA